MQQLQKLLWHVQFNVLVVWAAITIVRHLLKVDPLSLDRGHVDACLFYLFIPIKIEVLFIVQDLILRHGVLLTIQFEDVSLLLAFHWNVVGGVFFITLFDSLLLVNCFSLAVYLRSGMHVLHLDLPLLLRHWDHLLAICLGLLVHLLLLLGGLALHHLTILLHGLLHLVKVCSVTLRLALSLLLFGCHLLLSGLGTLHLSLILRLLRRGLIRGGIRLLLPHLLILTVHLLLIHTIY
jgi:hypothetical protein